MFYYYKQKKKDYFKTILLPKLSKTKKADILPNSAFWESIFSGSDLLTSFLQVRKAGIILLSQRMGTVGKLGEPGGAKQLLNPGFCYLSMCPEMAYPAVHLIFFICLFLLFQIA